MQKEIVDYSMKSKTNWILLMTVFSVSLIDASCSDDFLADLNQGTSVMYWSENNGDGNEEEFFRKFRALNPTIQKSLLTSGHHHKTSAINDSFPEESSDNDVRPLLSDAHTTNVENNNTKICCCTIS